MTKRHDRWDLVGRGSDPVPTSQFDVSSVARGFERTADGIAEAAGKLERLSRLDGWKGKAAEEFADSAEDSARELRKVQRRYEAIAAAIKAWGGPVERARSSTKREVDRAVDADERRRANLHSLLTGVEEPTDAQRAADERRRERLADAQADLRAAAHAVDTALDDLADDASRTAREIKRASETYKDGRWDRFKGWVRDHAGILSKISDVLQWVAIALAVIAFVIAVVVTAPAWLVAGVFVAGVVVGSALLAVDTALVTSGSGKKNWGDVALDVVGVVTMGYGKVATGAVRAGTKAVTGKLGDEAFAFVRTTRLGQEASTATGKLVNSASKIKNPANNLRIWADEQLRLRELVANNAGLARAREVVRQIEAISPSALKRVLAQDTDLAKAIAQLKEMRRFHPSSALQVEINAVGQKAREAVLVAALSTLSGIAGSPPVNKAIDVTGTLSEPIDRFVVEPLDDAKHFVLSTLGR